MLRISTYLLTATITIILSQGGCGDESEATLCETNGVSVTIADNHPNGSHLLEIPISDLSTTVDIVYDIQGNNTGHGHSATVSVADFESLEGGSVVSVTSTDTGAAGMDHTHGITLECNP